MCGSLDPSILLFLLVLAMQVNWATVLRYTVFATPILRSTRNFAFLAEDMMPFPLFAGFDPERLSNFRTLDMQGPFRKMFFLVGFSFLLLI